jgi:hypothetical protein
MKSANRVFSFALIALMLEFATEPAPTSIPESTTGPDRPSNDLI